MSTPGLDGSPRASVSRPQRRGKPERRDGHDGLRSVFEGCVRANGRLGWIVLAVTAPVLRLVASALPVAGQGQVPMADVGRSVESPALGRGTHWVANIACYGFGEEVGWRGFALPRLQARRYGADLGTALFFLLQRVAVNYGAFRNASMFSRPATGASSCTT